jgi:hypothetical protein
MVETYDRSNGLPVVFQFWDGLDAGFHGSDGAVPGMAEGFVVTEHVYNLAGGPGAPLH